MNHCPQDQQWEAQLQVILGNPPAPDFDEWCERNPATVVAIKNPVLLRGTNSEQRTIKRPLKWIVTAVIAVFGFMWMVSGGVTISKTAFADMIPGVDEVEAMTWTGTFYIRSTSADGQRTWINKERRLYAYRHPGLYRETFLDEVGNPRTVQITDARSGRSLQLDLRNKKAILKVVGETYDVNGPFVWIGEMLRERKRVKSISLQGQKKIDNKTANVVRALCITGDGLKTWSTDFFFDAESKGLVGRWIAEEKDFDPETAADRNQPAEKAYKISTSVGLLQHEILINPQLDRSDFQLEAPVGYTLETIANPTVTEDDIVTYLGAAARFNDNNFPDSPYHAYDTDKLNAAWMKEQSARLSAEQQLIEIVDKIRRSGIYESPVHKFENDQITPQSLIYVGSGVKVGAADQIVCWYRFRKAMKYRAIYGDLSVKDVTANQLPLKVAN